MKRARIFISIALLVLSGAAFVPVSASAQNCNEVYPAGICGREADCNRDNRLIIGNENELGCTDGKVCCIPRTCDANLGRCRAGAAATCTQNGETYFSSGDAECDSGSVCCIPPKSDPPTGSGTPPATGGGTTPAGSGTTQPAATEDGEETAAAVPRTTRGLINPLGPRSVPELVGTIVAWLGGLAGSAFLIFLLWGGVEYMMAGGDNTRVEKAKKRILYSVLGIVVIFLAFFLVDALIGLTNVPLTSPVPGTAGGVSQPTPAP